LLLTRKPKSQNNGSISFCNYGQTILNQSARFKRFSVIASPATRASKKHFGADNSIAPTLAGLGTNFGLAPLIGKRIAIISDARLGGHADQHAIVERLLSITGKDAITIDGNTRRMDRPTAKQIRHNFK
jgi:hypothetical protein